MVPQGIAQNKMVNPIKVAWAVTRRDAIWPKITKQR